MLRFLSLGFPREGQSFKRGLQSDYSFVDILSSVQFSALVIENIGCHGIEVSYPFMNGSISD